VLVQAGYGMSQTATAIALAVFDGGSMVAAFLLPPLLDRIADRTAMLTGASILTVGLALGPVIPGFQMLLPLWFLLGLGYSLTQTPSGRLLRRSSQPEDRPALFAAQFALSHSCWLLTYPVAGWLGPVIGLPATFATLAVIAALSTLLATRLWPAGQDLTEIVHVHDQLDVDHPHLVGAEPVEIGYRHSHPFVIDSHHPDWPPSA